MVIVAALRKKLDNYTHVLLRIQLSFNLIHQCVSKLNEQVDHLEILESNDSNSEVIV